MKHLLTTNELPIEEIHAILDESLYFAEGGVWQPSAPRFVSNLFFEPSTRTKTSFEVSQRKLGLQVIPFETHSSSVLKGETLYDTLMTLESIGINTVVIRHSQNHYFEEVANRIHIPIINAGDGCGHHPTQSLLDLFTIRQEFGQIAGLKIAVVGDIRHSRVARSNADVLTRLGAKVVFSGPAEWFDGDMLPSGYLFEPLDEAIKDADVVMLLRIQHERHKHQDENALHRYHERYGLTVEREKRMKPGSIVMHPAPVNRNVEIADSLVECKRSRIFKQMENGVYVRMAVLKRALEDSEGGNGSVAKNQKWPIAY